MNREITFDADVRRAVGSVLSQVTAVLREQQINPESLVWSSLPGSGVAKFWLMLPLQDAPAVPLLADRFREIPEVQNVREIATDAAVRPAPGSHWLEPPEPPHAFD